jgi:hypothetical protein
VPTTGYPSTTSVVQGQGLDFHLSGTPAGALDSLFERIGFGAITPLAPFAPSITSAAVPGANAWLGYGWPAYPFTVPGSWPSGLYRLKAHGPGETVHTDVLEFVVRAVVPGSTSKILLIADFVTPHAYHGAGGESLYASPSGRGNTVSFNRPLIPLAGHRELITWLNTNGHALEYASLVDLHVHPGILDGATRSRASCSAAAT